MELIKNDIIECEITDTGIKGEGIAHVEGRTLFIPGALPGERVRAKIIFLRKSFADGLLLKILKPSEKRIAAACPYFGKCGGCQLQHIERQGELEIKRKSVENAFRSVGNQRAQAQAVIAENRFNYRNKCSLPVRAGRDGEALIGFFAANSHRVVDIERCPLQYINCIDFIKVLREFCPEFISPYNEEKRTGSLRHAVLRQLGGRAYVTLVTTKRENLSRFAVLLGNIFPSFSLWQNINPYDTNVIFGKEFVFEGGDNSPVDVDGIKMDVHPAGFFQVNDRIRNRLWQSIEKELFPGFDTVVDAYSGAGFFTAKLAPLAKRAVGIELNPEAAASAVKTATLNYIDNMESICGDCAEILPGLETVGRTAVILDPPRAGCAKPVLKAAARAEKIIYISCYPPTLARDALVLKEEGAELVSLTPFDMFPCTVSVECLAVFEKKDG